MSQTEDTWMDVLDLGTSTDSLADEILADDVLGKFLTEELFDESEQLRLKRRTTYQKRKSQHINEIRRLRRTIEELEALRDSLQRSSGIAEDGQTLSSTADSLWMTVALRQHRRLQASQIENKQLLAEVREHESRISEIANLLLCDQKDEHLEIPSQNYSSHHSADTISAFLQLTETASSMLITVDTVFDNKQPPEEFQNLRVCHRNPTEIEGDSMIATITSNRFVPHTCEAISDCLWVCDVHDVAGDAVQVQLLHQERCDETQKIYFHVFLSTDRGVFLYHGAGVGLRRHEASRAVLVSSCLMWPDATTGSPWNSVSFLVRDWIVVEPLPGSGAQQMRSHSQSLRYAHPHAPEHLTPEEAATLQTTVARFYQRALITKNNRIDDMLVSQCRPSGISGVGI